jgi:hypothetical protein
MGATFLVDQPSDLLWQGRQGYLQRLAFDNVLFTRERLQTFLSDDKDAYQDAYQDICKRQMYARAELETRSSGLEMHEWVTTYQYEIADENEGDGDAQDDANPNDQNDGNAEAQQNVANPMIGPSPTLRIVLH